MTDTPVEWNIWAHDLTDTDRQQLHDDLTQLADKHGATLVPHQENPA